MAINITYPLEVDICLWRESGECVFVTMATEMTGNNVVSHL